MKIYISILILMPLLLGSCEKDFLEKTDYNGLNSETFMTTENQAKEAVTAIYDPLTQYGMYNIGNMVLGEVPTDNIQNDWGDGGFGPDIVSIHNFNWAASNQNFVYRWNNAYKGIARANFVLANINKVEGASATMLDQFKGEAYFLRALYYFNLVSGFGDIPLITEILSPSEINNIDKTAEEKVWDQIDLDLTEAAKLLPPSYASATDIGRATKGAAFGLQSRVRLWMKNYSGATASAKEVLKLNYNLVSQTDYGKMFDGRMENSSESVFEVQLIPNAGSIWNSDRAEGSVLMHIFPRLSWGRYFYPRKTATYDVVSAFEVGDMRRKASILIVGQDEIFYPSKNITGLFGDKTIYSDFKVDLQVNGAYQMRKFIPYDDSKWNSSDFNNGTSINIPVVRLAEVILNNAEALAQQDKLQEAWNELKKIRDRAGLSMVGVSNSDKNALLLQIKKDRRVELIFEGHRWGDLKRWGELNTISDAGLEYKANVNWPIPSVEININPKLGK